MGADSRLEDARGEVGVLGMDVFGGKEAHEGVPDSRELPVGLREALVGELLAVEGEEGRVGACLADGVGRVEDGGEPDAVGEGDEGRGGHGLGVCPGVGVEVVSGEGALCALEGGRGREGGGSRRRHGGQLRRRRHKTPLNMIHDRQIWGTANNDHHVQIFGYLFRQPPE